MLRRLFALVLIVAVAFGATAAPTLGAGLDCASAAAGKACKTCGDSGEPAEPSCPALMCTSLCAGGSMAWALRTAVPIDPVKSGKAAIALLSDRASARAIAPDIPPPR